MIEILSTAELARAKDTGALVAGILQTLRSRTTAGTNLLDIDRWAQTMILEAGAAPANADTPPPLGIGRPQVGLPLTPANL